MFSILSEVKRTGLCEVTKPNGWAVLPLGKAELVSFSNPDFAQASLQSLQEKGVLDTSYEVHPVNL